MPNAPKRHRPGGGRRWKRHAEALRGTAASRGYGWAWQRYRLVFLAEHPICVRHLAIGEIVPSRIVDHIVRVEGADDPLFWEPTNHQALCVACHNVKTNAEKGGAGFTRAQPWPRW